MAESGEKRAVRWGYPAQGEFPVLGLIAELDLIAAPRRTRSDYLPDLP